MATNKPLQSLTITDTSTSSITFSNLDQSYTDLCITVIGSLTSSAADLLAQFNSDTGSNYSATILYGNGTSATVYGEANKTYISLDWSAAVDSTNKTVYTCHIPNYSNSTTYKMALTRASNVGRGTDVSAGLWRSTAAITSVTLSTPTIAFSPGTTFNLYGIKSGAPKAMGGDTVTTDGNYWYHTFKTSGTFLLQQSTSVDYLVVAGGGGGNSYGSGGGAGGLRCTVGATGGGGSLESKLSMSPGSYTVTIGAGGSAGSTSSPWTSSNGSNSVFSTITSTGGGGVAQSTGQTGGSGGGSNFITTGYGNGNGGAGTANQGYAGGASQDLALYPGGGGGGAGAVGTTGTYGNPAGTVGGAGGIGIATSISGSSVYYAGGGGGGSWYNNPGGSGGTGGGGNGPTSGNNDAAAGTANTGGGGGGGGSTTGSSGALRNGAAGGSGIVIVRYAV